MSSLNWGDLVKDAGEATGGSYEPLPDGDYDLKVIEASAAVSQSGKTMFKITAEVQVGAFAKRRIWDNLVVSPDSPAALGIFFAKMAALGLNRDYFAASPSNSTIEAALLHRTFRAQIGSRVWQGSKKNEIKKYYVGAPVAAAGAPAPVAAAAPAPAPAPAPAAPVAEAPAAPVAPPAPPAAPASPF
jgi:hypothetical protein